MKNLKLFFLASALTITPALHAQDLQQDTLAVRVLLDENGLIGTGVSQVSTIDTGLMRITTLNLQGLKIETLTSELGVLDQLRSLVLADNLLDSLPAETWTLDQLVQFDVSNNAIGALDGRVSRLSNLLFLGFADNAVGAAPMELFRLPHLETLLLGGNALDTLSDSVANLAFLKILDVSGNALSAAPFTLAAMDLDSLDLSSNALATLPDLFTDMNAATKVRLENNALCNLSPALASWADSKDPGWKATQLCGSPIRAAAARPQGPALRAFYDGQSLRLDLRAPLSGSAMATVRDASGRVKARKPVAAGSTGLSFAAAELSGAGFLWAELRGGGAIVAAAPVLPR